MIPSPFAVARRVVPRWRSLALTIEAGELGAPPAATERHRSAPIAPELLDKLVDWRTQPGIITAGEVVETALVEAKESEAAAAARFLLSPTSTATPPLRRLAALALKRAGLQEGIPTGLEILPSEEKHVWRERTRLYPNNALAWVELSLLDLVRGGRNAALRSMLVALQLAPDNRHVLRSAARLFLHLHDPGRAYQIIVRSAATPDDPWLLSAEIALAELAHRKPRFFAQGRGLVQSSDVRPRQITELASAIGTLELVAGGRKKARDLFRLSMIDPTGNALAQAEWASPSFGSELVSSHRLGTTMEHDEAEAFHLIREKKFGGVVDACQRWSKMEPFSIRPYEVGSGTAATIGDYERALALARNGLMIRPDAPWLLNNQAFALVHLGRFKEAERSLRSVPHDDERLWLVSEANRGLLSMRRGNHSEGLAHYRNAIDGFRRQQDLIFAEIARAYLAREAAMAGLPDAKSLISEARTGLEKAGVTSHQHIIAEAEKALAERLG